MADGGGNATAAEALTLDEAATKIYLELVRENIRRNREIFEGFNPVTGKGAPGPRVKVKIPDSPVRVQYMPERCVRHNILIKKLIRRGTIRRYITDEMGWEYTDERYQDVVYAMMLARSEEDPAFYFALVYKIVDKEEGTVIPYILNYGQRMLLAKQEEMRMAGRPIRIVMPNADNSTLTDTLARIEHRRWNMAIMAHQTAASIRIRAMYDLALENQPGWSVGYKGRRLKSAPFKGSTADFVVKTNTGEVVRESVTTVASYENYDASRSANLKMAHLSEVAYWKETEQKKPEGVLSSLNGTIGNRPDTMIVMESSGRVVGDFFYNMYQEAKDPEIPSAWEAMYVPFFKIELYRQEFNPNYQGIFMNKIPWREVEEDPCYTERAMAFARWLVENKDNPNWVKGYRQTGKYFWQLWQKGASFEAISWCRDKINEFRSYSYFATEFPSDDVECFMAAGNLVFNKYSVDAMKQKMRKAPIFVGNIAGDEDKGLRAIRTARLIDRLDDGQALRIWQMPDCLKVNNRYVVSVDIGGRSKTSDFTVMTVIDRFGMMSGMGGRPKVVARWRGHIRHDLLAWKAAQLAHFYQDAMLVIEKNTADTRKARLDEEGEHSGTIIDEIADYYPNLYIGRTEVDKVTQKVTNVYGFHTNTLTKEQVIDNYIAYIEDELYEEPDEQAYTELLIYERKEDGTMGNVDGKNNHDDIVMSTGIGLWVSQRMPLPTWQVESSGGSGPMKSGTAADI